jgi:putative DNA primase/helicase
VDLLRSFAAPPADASRPARLAKPSLAAPFDVERWLATQGIAFERRAEINGSERWVLEHCPFNPSHLKPDAAVFRNAAGVLGFHCLHASCSGLDWRAFRNFIEPGRAQRREFRPANQSSPSPSDASDSGDEISIGAADVEAAADVAIAADDHSAAMRLIPELARLKAVSRVVIIAKLRQHFKKLWKDREFSQALAEAIEAQRAAGSPTPDDDDPEGPESTGPDLLPFPLTDAGNGERIVKMFGDQIRYCVEMKGWLVWDGIRWVFDSFEVTRQKGKQMCRLLYEQAKKFEKSNFQLFARASESYSAVTNALNFASTEPGIRITAAELDQHPNLLNCPNGVVNLRDGKILRHNKDFMITKLCPWPYLPSAKAERFIDFLQWAMGANPDAEISDRTVRLVGFLQRAFGYALTADVTEKAVFIFYGKAGNNGKTTLLTIFRDLLGRDYSGQIAIETVMATAKQQDATMRADLADLRGVRLVVTSEVEKESKLNEGKIKYITAGTAPIKSCRKYENPIEFWATHKLFMDCNHRPIIRGSEDAIWKRLKLVPFEVQIDDADIDKNLPDKLRTEMPGILAWAVRGCMDWMKAGLGEPPEVKSAGREWREHDDPLKEFLDDYCEVDLEMAHAPDPTDRLFVPAADLTEAYLFWAKQANEKFPLTKETLRERLESKGFWVYRSRRIGPDKKQTRTWEGLKLRNDVAGTSRRTSGFGPTWDRDG